MQQAQQQPAAAASAEAQQWGADAAGTGWGMKRRQETKKKVKNVTKALGSSAPLEPACVLCTPHFLYDPL
jgi:hypothetical protein